MVADNIYFFANNTGAKYDLDTKQTSKVATFPEPEKVLYCYSVTSPYNGNNVPKENVQQKPSSSTEEPPKSTQKSRMTLRNQTNPSASDDE